MLPIEQLRLLHFLLMFLFVGFAIHHVYSSVLFDIEERNGELSSMVTGYKADVLDGETPRDDPRRDPGVRREDRPREGEPLGDDPAASTDMSRAGVVVIGLRNVVRSDDGVGVQAVAPRLRERLGSRPHVTLVEGARERVVIPLRHSSFGPEGRERRPRRLLTCASLKGA